MQDLEKLIKTLQQGVATITFEKINTGEIQIGRAHV